MDTCTGIWYRAMQEVATGIALFNCFFIGLLKGFYFIFYSILQQTTKMPKNIISVIMQTTAHFLAQFH